MSQMRAIVGSAPREASGSEVTGVVVSVQPSYPREVGIGWHILLPILVTAGVARMLGLLLATLLREGKSSGGGRRTLKELRRGPEFLVTEFTVRRDDGTLVELEVHGHLARAALIPRDRVRAEVRRQRRHDLPLRAHRIDNYTSGRAHRPPGQTMWTHLGPAVLLQALAGLAISLLVAASLMM